MFHYSSARTLQPFDHAICATLVRGGGLGGRGGGRVTRSRLGLRGGEMTEETEVRRRRSGFVLRESGGGGGNNNNEKSKSKREGKSARSDATVRKVFDAC